VTAIAEVLVVGVRDGAIFSLMGLGLALVYKSTGILNFAQGELGTSAAFVAFLVMSGFAIDGRADRGLILPASLAAIVAGALLGVALYVLVIRRLGQVSAVTSLVVTAGVFLMLFGLGRVVFEERGRPFPRYIDGTFGLPFIDVSAPYQTLVVLAVLGAAAAGLAAFFRSSMGVALLAAAQDPFAAELQGIPVERLRALSWGMAGALGTLAGLLIAGLQPALTSGLGTFRIMIPAFIGVVLGGITSMVGAVIGGFVLGIVAQAAVRINASFELGVSGEPQLAWFIVLIAVLLFRPQGLLAAKR
jgi:branched-chain amino acid transport system permease protein